MVYTYPTNRTSEITESLVILDIEATVADIEPTIQPKNSSNEKKLLTELMKRYKIGRNQLYKRMGYLRIKPWKIGSRSYVYGEQLGQMDGLHDHIQQTGMMRGYPVPPRSGPWEEETASESAIARFHSA